MREILFRGKRTNNGEWVEGKGIDLNFDTAYILTKEYDSCSGYYMGEFEVIPETIGQFTGLTDKNGKKIFEGDIVKHYHDKKFPKSYSKGVIYWEEEYLRWKRTSENATCCIANDCIYEVIGNIHDNPELLERSENGTSI